VTLTSVIKNNIKARTKFGLKFNSILSNKNFNLLLITFRRRSVRCPLQIDQLADGPHT